MLRLLPAGGHLQCREAGPRSTGKARLPRPDVGLVSLSPAHVSVETRIEDATLANIGTRATPPEFPEGGKSGHAPIDNHNEHGVARFPAGCESMPPTVQRAGCFREDRGRSGQDIVINLAYAR